jgi:hypothetical protein
MNKAAVLALSITAALALPDPARSHDDPPPPRLKFAFEETVMLGAAIPVGETPLGKRNIIPITGGTFKGPGIQGNHHRRRLGLAAHARRRVHRCRGRLHDQDRRRGGHQRHQRWRPVPSQGRATEPGPDPAEVRGALCKYDWLNRSAFIGTLEMATDAGGPAVRIRFYRPSERRHFAEIVRL